MSHDIPSERQSAAAMEHAIALGTSGGTPDFGKTGVLLIKSFLRKGHGELNAVESLLVCSKRYVTATIAALFHMRIRPC